MVRKQQTRLRKKTNLEAGSVYQVLEIKRSEGPEPMDEAADHKCQRSSCTGVQKLISQSTSVSINLPFLLSKYIHIIMCKLCLTSETESKKVS